ncbi:response regulator transcription factor [Ensifer adhaerens]|uniref:Response regulator n=2 Tax=Ensifer adhaerens TaxID=106592 RepID=A0A9Q8YH01_ENSAD|nr:response regulator [Ensifer adhaerens]USJ27394.1 response regulator [Ensifer adhaerens]UTV41018.1 response regulator [Ensifer adhaerens]
MAAEVFVDWSLVQLDPWPSSAHVYGMSELSPAIAIVDDDELVRRALSRLVASLSCQPIAFSSAEAFLLSLDDAVPQGALIDLHLPGMTGLELLQELGRRGIVMKTIVITGSEAEGARERCLQSGATAFLNKPLSRDVLAGALDVSDQ